MAAREREVAVYRGSLVSDAIGDVVSRFALLANDEERAAALRELAEELTSRARGLELCVVRNSSNSFDIRAHRLASEIASRLAKGKALGTPSAYNITREVLIEEFAKEEGL